MSKISKQVTELTGLVLGYTANKADLPSIVSTPIRFNGANYATPFKYLEIRVSANSDQQVLDFDLRGINSDDYFEDATENSFFDFTTICIPYGELSATLGASNEEIEQAEFKLNNDSVSEQYNNYILIDLFSNKIYSKVWKNHIVIEEILANVINDSLTK
jgi:hypothetical protein